METPEKINLQIDQKDLNALLNKLLGGIIESSISQRRTDIEASIKKMFSSAVFDSKRNDLEDAVHWNLNYFVDEGVKKALEELDYKTLIANKAKELLSDNDFIAKLAHEKVLRSLGLPVPQITE